MTSTALTRQSETTSHCPSTIAAMHAAYERAQTAHTANEEAELRGRASGETTIVHVKCQEDAHHHSVLLARAIMYEMPTSMDDLLIVLYHAANAADTIATSEPIPQDPDAAALNIAMENATAFVSRAAGVNANFGRRGHLGVMLYRKWADARFITEAA